MWLFLLALVCSISIGLIVDFFIKKRRKMYDDYCGDQPRKHLEETEVSILVQESVDKHRVMVEKIKNDRKFR